ncbi:hypothetical protein B0H13DRAFT_1876337 [Mycena leptocephala]|nr:hypothetical protein B0H13DRAFT_1876337 [Mycena leptocephala]
MQSLLFASLKPRDTNHISHWPREMVVRRAREVPATLAVLVENAVMPDAAVVMPHRAFGVHGRRRGDDCTADHAQRQRNKGRGGEYADKGINKAFHFKGQIKGYFPKQKPMLPHAKLRHVIKIFNRDNFSLYLLHRGISKFHSCSHGLAGPSISIVVALQTTPETLRFIRLNFRAAFSNSSIVLTNDCMIKLCPQMEELRGKSSKESGSKCRKASESEGLDDDDYPVRLLNNYILGIQIQRLQR